MNKINILILVLFSFVSSGCKTFGILNKTNGKNQLYNTTSGYNIYVDRVNITEFETVKARTRINFYWIDTDILKFNEGDTTQYYLRVKRILPKNRGYVQMLKSSDIVDLSYDDLKNLIKDAELLEFEYNKDTTLVINNILNKTGKVVKLKNGFSVGYYAKSKKLSKKIETKWYIELKLGDGKGLFFDNSNDALTFFYRAVQRIENMKSHDRIR